MVGSGQYVHGLVCRMCTFGTGVEERRGTSEKGSEEGYSGGLRPEEASQWGYTLWFILFMRFMSLLVS